MTGIPARALSIARPWAGLIVHGYKPVENRTWSTRYRGTLIVHASQRWDRAVADIAEALGLPGSKHGHATGYVGSVDLVDVHHATDCGGCSIWAEPGAWHWVMQRAQQLSTPIPGPGRLGLYSPPKQIIATFEEAA